jgi:hypothetical protein
VAEEEDIIDYTEIEDRERRSEPADPVATDGRRTMGSRSRKEKKKRMRRGRSG